MQVTIDIVPVEAHWSIGLVERYHQPLRRAYEIIKTESPDTPREMTLQIVVKAVNDTAGPDGLVPTLLVFGAYPKIADSDTLTTTVAQRARAIQLAMKEVTRLHAQQMIQKALAARNGPDTSTVLDAPVNSKLWAWRESQQGQRAGWKGPYPLISTDGERCILQLPNCPTAFRTTHVKRYYGEDIIADPGDDTDIDMPSTAPLSLSEPPPEPEKRKRGRPRKNPLPNVMFNFTDIILS